MAYHNNKSWPVIAMLTVSSCLSTGRHRDNYLQVTSQAGSASSVSTTRAGSRETRANSGQSSATATQTTSLATIDQFILPDSYQNCTLNVPRTELASVYHTLDDLEVAASPEVVANVASVSTECMWDDWTLV
jgi:hypothetical protein